MNSRGYADPYVSGNHTWKETALSLERHVFANCGRHRPTVWIYYHSNGKPNVPCLRASMLSLGM